MPVSLKAVVEEAAKVVVGVDNQIRLALCCLLARGHLLIEDLPGIGKTILAQALARILGLEYQRIQFTSDMLPGDILGVSVFSRELGGFQFHPGPSGAQMRLTPFPSIRRALRSPSSWRVRTMGSEMADMMTKITTGGAMTRI